MAENKKHTQGGTHEQHVKAGHAGGEAPHVCRGRECSSKEAKSESKKHEKSWWETLTGK